MNGMMVPLELRTSVLPVLVYKHYFQQWQKLEVEVAMNFWAQQIYR